MPSRSAANAGVPYRDASSPAKRDRAIASALEQWFAASARDLPWRQPLPQTKAKSKTKAKPGSASSPLPRRDPYRSLVSEAMLQQTQVSRVLDFFDRFIARFPTVQALADADEQAVLAAWAGLGYYRRARQLQAAARAIVTDHAGHIPADPTVLRTLPGVGRYTAGAIASMVFSQRTPLVDGNVARVLLRIDNQPMPLGQPATDRWAWQRAEQLVAACSDPAAFNESLMELGATVCTPKQPACAACPLNTSCIARAQGTQSTIPLPKKPTPKRELIAEVLLARMGRNTIALQQRPATGLWASMWQLPTYEHASPSLDAAGASAHFSVGRLTPAKPFTHQTTHRTVIFQPWHLAKPLPARAMPAGWVRVSADELADYPMSNPQRTLAATLL